MKIDRGNLRGAFGVLLALSLIFLLHVIRPHSSIAPDFECGMESSSSVRINIASGETGLEISKSLERQGVVKSSTAFFRLAVSDKRAERIAPGAHVISKNLCAKQALNQLLDSKRISNLLTISEGAWISEIKKSLSSIGYSNAEISVGFSHTQPLKGFASLEGLLFPAQYSFTPGQSVEKILALAIKRASSELAKSGISSGGSDFSPSQLLTIASLIQAEGDEKDFARISQVVRNRLKRGMPLQFDSTIHYIKGSRGSVFLSTQSTLIKSPYNTYKRYGLPPGPINNPGASAMYAATHPEKGVWLYFITVAPGDTRFTDSLAEFNQWKVLYKSNLRKGLFRSK